MPPPDLDWARFASVLAAFGDELPRVVIVGGWAHRLFPFHPLARRSLPAPITTTDMDVVLSTAHGPRANLDQRLRDADFRVERSGRVTPQITTYYPADAADEFHVEFLVPRVGAEVDRRGARRSAMEIGGVVAQLLPHLDLLIDDAWRVAAGDRGHPSAASRFEVCIPNAARYLAHKLLVLEERQRAKQPNDVRYLHDTIQVFGDALPEVSELAARIHWSPQGRRRFRRGRRLLQPRDLLVRAARITPEIGDVAAMKAALDAGLDALFGRA